MTYKVYKIEFVSTETMKDFLVGDLIRKGITTFSVKEVKKNESR